LTSDENLPPLETQEIFKKKKKLRRNQESNEHALSAKLHTQQVRSSDVFL
jgi:hypothetical protein